MIGIVRKRLIEMMYPKGMPNPFLRKTTEKSSAFPLKEKISQQYRKVLLLLLAAAFFLSVLFLADRIPAPKLKIGESSREVLTETAPTKKKSHGKQILLGTVIALLMIAAVGAGIWAVVQSRGGRSAKESVGMEESLITEGEPAESGQDLWTITSDATFELPEEEVEEITESVSEEAVEEEPEEELDADDLVMPGRQAIQGDVIFVGDSRFVAMSTAVRFDDLYIARVAIGYDWFRDTAIPELDRAAVPGARVVINMGVNDLENAGRYAELINENMDRWTAAGLILYYMSVNPVIDGKSYATNEMIEKFNAKMQETLDPRVYWIDTYTPLMESGIQSPDGVHYRDETSRLIYEYCRKALEENAPEQPVIRQLELQTPEEGLPEGVLPVGGEVPLPDTQPAVLPQAVTPSEEAPVQPDIQPPVDVQEQPALEAVPVQP